MTKFKILIVLLLTFVVVGCGKYNDVEINLANYICKDRGGLYQLNAIYLDGEVVHCKDNTRHQLQGVIPLEEIEVN